MIDKRRITEDGGGTNPLDTIDSKGEKELQISEELIRIVK